MTGTSKTTVDGIFLGARSTIITPEPGCELSGFIARVEPMAGMHDELQANAMIWAEDAALTNAAGLVTLDVVELDADSVVKIRARIEMLAGIAGERIGVTCTHTHGGPATMPGRSLGNANVEYLDRLCQLVAETVSEAARAIAPAIVSWGVGNEPTVGKNRRIPGGIIDPDVAVIRFQRADGTVTALL